MCCCHLPDAPFTLCLSPPLQYGWTPAHVAASMGCKNSISALLHLRADFEQKNKEGLSAIDIMNRHCHYGCSSIATGQQKAKFIPTKSSSSPLLSLAGELLLLVICLFVVVVSAFVVLVSLFVVVVSLFVVVSIAVID